MSRISLAPFLLAMRTIDQIALVELGRDHTAHPVKLDDRVVFTQHVLEDADLSCHHALTDDADTVTLLEARQSAVCPHTSDDAG